MKLFALATLALAANYVSAYCPNLCSGHGVCETGDTCRCYEYVGTGRGDYTNAGLTYDQDLRAAWTGADCSLRTCPVAYSWSGATPNGLGASATASSATGVTVVIPGNFVDPDSHTSVSGGLTAGSKIRITGETGLFTVKSASFSSPDTTITTVESIVTGGAVAIYLEAVEYEHVNKALDAKDANGAHSMLECAGQGICDRATGNCDCFPGYEGEACTRSVCPNDCSGNGICLSAQRLAADASHTYTFAWDSEKHFGCKCDAGFRGPDCSLQECPSDYDPMFGCGGGQCNAGSTDTSGATCANNGSSDCTDNEQRDCSGRGICDYESGMCKCFSGFFGEACEKQTILI